jgi:heme/copper-type cytochrome/quinol oxidase subunit 1
MATSTTPALASGLWRAVLPNEIAADDMAQPYLPYLKFELTVMTDHLTPKEKEELPPLLEVPAFRLL